MKKLIFRQWGQIVVGLIIFSVGVHCTIFANIGLAPWDCLAMGLSYHIPLNYGMTVTMISLIIIVIDLLLKERIGFGTLLDALIVGNTVQFFNDLNPLPLNHGILTGIPIMLVGFVFLEPSAAAHATRCWSAWESVCRRCPSVWSRSGFGPLWFWPAGCWAARWASAPWSACWAPVW